jgi:hypothetical protein
MKKIRLLTCNRCKESKSICSDHFFPGDIRKAEQNHTKKTVPTCRQCENAYQAERKRLSRLKPEIFIDGTIYVFTVDLPGAPYKIGMTSGRDTRKRKSQIQTSHWMSVKEVWKSDYFPKVNKLEEKLHKHFDRVRVHGEWFNINEDDIKSIPKLMEEFSKELA